MAGTSLVGTASGGEPFTIYEDDEILDHGTIESNLVFHTT